MKVEQRGRNGNVAYGATSLATEIRSRFIDNGNGLLMHVLEAGIAGKGRPCVLLLHGFPELAYSWREVMLPLAAAGYHVIAPDQRGYGRTSGGDARYDGDVAQSRMINLVMDTLGLVCALGYRSITAVIGHDFGSPVAAWCALLRPDVFRSVVLLSAPFAGPPASPEIDIQSELAALRPPRKHYQWYYSTRSANDDMQHCSQGMRKFLRDYYYMKSADWKGNQPFTLRSWAAEELAKLPKYYVMDLDKGMAETVAAESTAEIAVGNWLSEDELDVYSDEYARTGFQGGLQWYRCLTNPEFRPELETYSGRTIDVPSCFIGGKSDWGVYQSPGALDSMSTVCTRFQGVHLVEGAGHWVQQEQAQAVTGLIKQFLARQS